MKKLFAEEVEKQEVNTVDLASWFSDKTREVISEANNEIKVKFDELKSDFDNLKENMASLETAEVKHTDPEGAVE